MNPEFLAKFTSDKRSYRCSYKMIYGESTLCTIPRLHFKLNAIHGHATWQHHSPSPLTLKIKKTPLPNLPIHWRVVISILECPVFRSGPLAGLSCSVLHAISAALPQKRSNVTYLPSKFAPFSFIRLTLLCVADETKQLKKRGDK